MFRRFMDRRRLVARVALLESIVVKLDRVAHPALAVCLTEREAEVYDPLVVEAAAVRAALRDRTVEATRAVTA